MKKITTNSKEIFCSKCGHKIKKNDSFCPGCGNKINKTTKFKKKKIIFLLLPSSLILIVLVATASYLVYTRYFKVNATKSTKATQKTMVGCIHKDQVLSSAKMSSTSILRDDGGHGTAFTIDQNAHLLLTNYHVVKGAKSLKGWDGISGTWQTVKIDKVYPELDLAIVQSGKVSTTPPSWAYSDELEQGEDLYALGWPESTSGQISVTKGSFSRKVKVGNIEYIQTDTPINPGNSGGILMNNCGVVGINTSKVVTEGVEGIGFAISQKTIMSSLPIKYGSFENIRSKQITIIDSDKYKACLEKSEKNARGVLEEYSKSRSYNDAYNSYLWNKYKSDLDCELGKEI